jgi:hypothetical protein
MSSHSSSSPSSANISLLSLSDISVPPNLDSILAEIQSNMKLSGQTMPLAELYSSAEIIYNVKKRVYDASVVPTHTQTN